MVSEEPKVSPTGRYSMVQASQALGIHRNTLKRYSEEGHIKFGIHAISRRKFFLGSEILKLWRKQI